MSTTSDAGTAVDAVTAVRASDPVLPPSPASRWRFMPLETYPRLVTIMEHPLGKVWLLVVFGGLLSWFNTLWLPVSLTAMACALAGRHRPYVVSVATVGMLLLAPEWFNWSAPRLASAREGGGAIQLPIPLWACAATILGLSVAAIHIVRRRPASILARRPVLALITTAFLLMLVAASGAVKGTSLVVLWAFLATLIPLLWFLSYALSDEHRKADTPAGARMGGFHPFWGSSSVPLGKSPAYWRRFEAQDGRQLAIVQLKGLKLLAWAAVLTVLWGQVRIVAVDIARIPTLQAALEHQVAGEPYPWYLCWASTGYAFFDSMLSLTVWGHASVATARLAGIGLLRNTCRPLSSTTLAQFFNRYYYYYKELLVDFFFYPTFLRWFKGYPRVRVLAATFMAAGVGNLLFHFLRDSRHVAELGMGATLRGFQPFAFYCAVLGASLGVSQLRSRRQIATRGWFRRQLLPSLFVLLFYCVLQVFMDTYSPHSLADHFRFVGRLLGLHAWT